MVFQTVGHVQLLQLPELPQPTHSLLVQFVLPDILCIQLPLPPVKSLPHHSVIWPQLVQLSPLLIQLTQPMSQKPLLLKLEQTLHAQSSPLPKREHLPPPGLALMSPEITSAQPLLLNQAPSHASLPLQVSLGHQELPIPISPTAPEVLLLVLLLLPLDFNAQFVLLVTN